MTTFGRRTKTIEKSKIIYNFSFNKRIGDSERLILNIVKHQVHPVSLPGDKRQAESSWFGVNRGKENMAQNLLLLLY